MCADSPYMVNCKLSLLRSMLARMATTQLAYKRAEGLNLGYSVPETGLYVKDWATG